MMAVSEALELEAGEELEEIRQLGGEGGGATGDG